MRSTLQDQLTRLKQVTQIILNVSQESTVLNQVKKCVTFKKCVKACVMLAEPETLVHAALGSLLPYYHSPIE